MNKGPNFLFSLIVCPALQVRIIALLPTVKKVASKLNNVHFQILNSQTIENQIQNIPETDKYGQQYEN